jgi:hypothetical protein
MDCGYSGVRVPEAANHGAFDRAPPRHWHGFAVLDLLALGVDGMKPSQARLLRWGIAVVVAAAVVVVIWVLKSGGPENQLVGHLEAMVELLETHKDAPEQAAAAVEAYVEEHRAELESLRAEFDRKRSGLKPEEVADLAGDLLRKSGPVMERAHRLMREHPGLADNERLQKALESLSK